MISEKVKRCDCGVHSPFSYWGRDRRFLSVFCNACGKADRVLVLKKELKEYEQYFQDRARGVEGSSVGGTLEGGLQGVSSGGEGDTTDSGGQLSLL